MSALLAKLDTILAPVVQSMNLQYWGVEMVSEDGRAILRVYINKEGGASIDDCVSVSRSISALLDVEEPIAAKYSLEVSTPGINRPLLRPEHYQTSLLQSIDLKLHAAVDGKKKLTGILVEVTDDAIMLRCDESEHKITFKQIKRANLS